MSGREIGLIVPSDRAAERPAADIASAAALLAEMVRLRLELESALKEVAGSRERLLRASYSERRRLEQDLHDGAQQRLVSLGMALRLLQRHLDDPVSTVSGMLDAAVAEIGTAVAELRQIAHGLRPSSLDDGLEAALTNLSRSSAIPIELDIDVGALPDLVSTTAYFVANEAVANAVKHSEAVKVAVCVQAVDGSVNVTISDDGLGGATLAQRATAAFTLTAANVRIAAGSTITFSIAKGGTGVVVPISMLSLEVEWD
jgi:signal transduction histidine kinase